MDQRDVLADEKTRRRGIANPLKFVFVRGSMTQKVLAAVRRFVEARPRDDRALHDHRAVGPDRARVRDEEGVLAGRTLRLIPS